MVAYSFKPMFVEPIQALTKAQTIRAVGRRRHARPGDELQLYTGMRTRACRLIGRASCFCVRPISIDVRLWEIVLDGVELRRAELNALARIDGFQDRKDMAAFWLKEHGPGLFEGLVISWRELRLPAELDSGSEPALRGTQ